MPSLIYFSCANNIFINIMLHLNMHNLLKIEKKKLLICKQSVQNLNTKKIHTCSDNNHIRTRLSGTSAIYREKKKTLTCDEDF